MKIAAYYIVHYGREWLHWSIESIINHVDEVNIFYTPNPSHGHNSIVRCPELRQTIRLSLETFRHDPKYYQKVFWYDTITPFPHEGVQRDHAVKVCRDNGADIILVVDADELWNPEVLEKALDYAKNTDAYQFGIGMRHFWRSTKWVCDDQAMPIRIIKPNSENASTNYMSADIGKVFHFGYAQSPQIIEYKQKIHGHKAEWRKDWFNTTFMPWTPENPFGDVHPTCVNYWYPKPIASEASKDWEVVKELCKDHPYLYADLITDGLF